MKKLQISDVAILTLALFAAQGSAHAGPANWQRSSDAGADTAGIAGEPVDPPAAMRHGCGVAQSEATDTDPSASPARSQQSQQSLEAALKQALSQPAPSVEPAQRAVDTLSFVPDAAVTAREQDRFVAFLAAQPGNGADLEPAIRSGKLLGEFERLLRRYDHSPHNLGDVLAAHLVLSWEIVNERDSNDVPAGQRAVRRQLAGALASVPAIAAMSDARKQAQAERTAYMTMLAVSAYQSLKNGGDPARLASLQRSVRQSLIEDAGIDLRKLELTEQGLVSRD